MSFNIGLSGLNASAKNLDVIGHNIANANTTGMKAFRTEFSETYASALGAMGGSNGGIGVGIAAVSQSFTQGNIKATGNSLDMAINGNGFFKVTLTDGSTAYTRAGEFKVDKDGNIVTNSSAKVQGYATDPDTGKRTSVVTQSLQLPTGGIIAPKLTSTMTLKANLDSRTADQTTTAYGAGTAADPFLKDSHKTYGTSINVYDTLGNAVPLEVYFVKNATAGSWDVVYSVDGGVTALGGGVAGAMTFDTTTGLPTSTMPGFTIAAAVPPATVPSTAITVAAADIDIGNATDGWSLTQYGSKFAIYDIRQDGYAPGQMTDLSVGEDGLIKATFSNGKSQYVGQVSLTNFRNVQGLASTNGGYWKETSASGQPVEGAPMEGTMGSIRAKSLEESNVDMTAELVNMMVAQRAYQANSQTIKTQDQVLSTLVNMR